MRRAIVLATAIAVGAISGLALGGARAATQPDALSRAGGLSAGQDATIAPQLARMSQTWADRPSDDRHATHLPLIVLSAALAFALFAAGVIAASVSLTLHQATHALAPVRGPPPFQLA